MFDRSKRRFVPGVDRFEARTLLSTVRPSVMPRVVVASAVEAGQDGGGFNLSRLSGERGKQSASDYPLLGQRYEVLAPSSDRYNCIAHSLGLHDRWIAPRTTPGPNPLAGMDKLYAKYGYTRQPTLDTSLQSDAIKVAVYGYVRPNGVVREVRHAALQRVDGTWTSKLGHNALIRHPKVASVSGPSYGRLVAVYARPV